MATPETKKFFCNGPIKHNGTLYEDTIDLTEDEAEPLLEAEAISTKRVKVVEEEIPAEPEPEPEPKAKAGAK